MGTELTAMLAHFPPVPMLYLPKSKSFGEPKPPRTTPKIGRNAPCPCGCGKKYKKCLNKK